VCGGQQLSVWVSGPVTAPDSTSVALPGVDRPRLGCLNPAPPSEVASATAAA
jgi:hypothetical protein